MVNGGWIRVEERLPENDVKVLLLFNFLDNHIESGFITNLFYDSEEWVHYLYDGDSYDENPTHWMPLPAAPGIARLDRLTSTGEKDELQRDER